MGYEVLARKWRPQQFADVVGQEHVTQTLVNAIAADRIAHAYLFVGPRGIGKTSVARIMAKALNCERGPTATPCDVCDACREIMAGNNLDVMEIDGASNNGVEQVRELRDTVRYAPVRGPFKIYIIDEVHMLSNAAFNALLKTLEEPPDYVKFIFATTEPDKVLATIISRCQRFDLRRIPLVGIVDRLRLIAHDEGLTIDEDALLAIARGSEGGLRDAESALDQLISFKGKTIREEDVLSVFGLVSRQSMESLAQSILDGKIPDVIRYVHTLDQGGKDLRRLSIELMEYFRNLLVCMHIDGSLQGMDLTEAQVHTLKGQAETTDTDRVLEISRILADAEDRMKFALSRRTLLETALIRCARAATVVGLDEILKRLNALLGDGEGGAGGAGPAQVARARPAVGYTANRPAEGQVREKAVAKAVAMSDGESLELLRRQWDTIRDAVGRMTPLARVALCDAHPAGVSGATVTVALEAEFAAELDNLKATRSRRTIEHAISEALNRRVHVEFVVAAGESGDGVTAAVPEGAKREAESGAISGGEAAGAVPVAGEHPTGTDWRSDPVVRKAMDLFKCDVVDIRGE